MISVNVAPELAWDFLREGDYSVADQSAVFAVSGGLAYHHDSGLLINGGVRGDVVGSNGAVSDATRMIMVGLGGGYTF